jgi:hypothetical protein
MFRPHSCFFLTLFLLAQCGPTVTLAWSVVNAEVPEPTKAPGRYEIIEKRPGEESIFDITFGSPPPLATERGILIIDAYNDLNNNQLQDDNELPLAEEISCRLGGIDYRVPAFIPGLGYNDSYSVTCSGQTYQPTKEQPEVFIEKRGQVIRLNIPCRTLLAAPDNSTK